MSMAVPLSIDIDSAWDMTLVRSRWQKPTRTRSHFEYLK